MNSTSQLSEEERLVRDSWMPAQLTAIVLFFLLPFFLFSAYSSSVSTFHCVLCSATVGQGVLALSTDQPIAVIFAHLSLFSIYVLTLSIPMSIGKIFNIANLRYHQFNKGLVRKMLRMFAFTFIAFAFFAPIFIFFRIEIALALGYPEFCADKSKVSTAFTLSPIKSSTLVFGRNKESCAEFPSVHPVRK